MINPFVEDKNPDISEKRFIYRPTTPYGLGKLIETTLEGEYELPEFRIPWKSKKTPDIVWYLLAEKENETLIIKPAFYFSSGDQFQKLLTTAIILYTQDKENKDKFLEDLNISENRFLGIVKEEISLNFDEGLDIECYINEQTK